MDNEIIQKFAEIAGIGGVCVGTFLTIAREILKLNIFANINAKQTVSILKILILLSFVIAVLGIAVFYSLR